MLSVYTGADWLPVANRDNYSVKYQYEGDQLLSFDISPNDPAYPYLKEETVLRDQGNEYLIKSINERAAVSTIQASINMDDWRVSVWREYRRTNKTISDILTEIKPLGWSVIDAELASIGRTTELSDCTAYDILMSLKSTYGIVFALNALDKTVQIIKPENRENKGLYATDELNLKKIEYKGDTNAFYTRLYPYGVVDENGNQLDITSVNGGIPYVENHQYSDKTIAAVWVDERYTVAQNLKDAALEMLKAASKPATTYQLDLIRIPDLDMRLYDKLTVLYPRRGTRQEHQIVEITEYPDRPVQNKAVLSSTAKTIEGTVVKKVNDLVTVVESTEKRVFVLNRDIDTISAKVENTYTKGETDANINSSVSLSVDSVLVQVAEAYVTGDQMDAAMSALRQTVEGIELSVTKQGGGNKIINSVGRGGAVGWTVSGVISTTAEAAIIGDTSAKSAFVIANGAMTQSIPVRQGALHTLCFLYQKNNCHLRIKIDGQNVLDTAEIVNNWAYVSYPFTPQAGSTTLELSTDSPYAYIADLMLSEGITQAWSQAPNEIYDTGFSVDQRGVIVSQSGSGTKTIIDATGTRVVSEHNDADIIAQFDTNGTRTKTLTSAGQISAGKVRLIPQPDGLMTVVND